MKNYIAAHDLKELDIANLNSHIEKEQHERKNYHNIVCVKPWGHEFLVYESNKIGIWCLTVLQDKQTSLHCHFKKDTLLIVLSGCAKIGFFDGKIQALTTMETLFIPKKKFHSIGSFSEHTCVLEIEIFSNQIHFSDKNDLLRIHDQYHRKPIGYESSVDLVHDNLNHYDHFTIDKQGEYKINNTIISCKNINTEYTPNEGVHSILLDGYLQSETILCKEGSLLKQNTTYIALEPSIILEISKYDWKEDAKIIHTFDQLLLLTQQLKTKQKQIVLTSGCFDILHVGHLRTLKIAKTLGDILIVCLSSDEQITALKGKGRPVNAFQDRLGLFKTIECVDYIFPYIEKFIETEETLGIIMKTIDPDIWVKGSDYTEKAIQEKHPYLRKIHLIPLLTDKSTTNIVKKINQSS